MFKKYLNSKFFILLPILIVFAFFIAYSTLSIVRHNNYNSFGYDLGINDQVVWKYSQFKAPISTVGPRPTETKLATHVELVYALISPFYWIWSSRQMLLILEAFFICFSGLAIYLLAIKRGLKKIVALSVLIVYLSFYGVQNAMWFDVHSATFAASFLALFLYFLDTKKKILASVLFILAITARENIALITFLISFAYFIKRRDKQTLIYMVVSILYLLFIFLIFFPHIIQQPYLYQNQGGLLSNINPTSLIDTQDKKNVIFYSLASFGFLPLFNPLSLLPVLGHLVTYFILASDLPGAQGLYMHYRVTMAPLLAWSTIVVISKIKRLNNKYIAIYLILCAIFVQYVLHLPLSYLAKDWFWKTPDTAKNVRMLREFIPQNASVVSQNNITPHLSQRDFIYTLYPEKKDFLKDSPCNQKTCDWFRWAGNPEYLIVDTSNNWDIRHFLTSRDEFISALENIEKRGIIEPYQKSGSALLYKVLKNPDNR